MINGVMGLDRLGHDASRPHNVDQSVCLKDHGVLQHPVGGVYDGG